MIKIEIPDLKEEQNQIQEALNEIAKIRRHLVENMSGVSPFPKKEDDTQVIRWIYPHLRFYTRPPGRWSAQMGYWKRPFKYLPHRATDMGKRGCHPCPMATERDPEIVTYLEFCEFIKALPEFLEQLWREYENIPQISITLK